MSGFRQGGLSKLGLIAFKANQSRGASPHDFLIKIPCRTTSMFNCQFAIHGSRSYRCVAALTLAKLHALVSGFVLIRKSLTLPMGPLYIPVKHSSSAVPASRSSARKSPIFIRPFPESYADVLSASRAIFLIKSLQRPSATSQGKVNSFSFCIFCKSSKANRVMLTARLTNLTMGDLINF